MNQFDIKTLIENRYGQNYELHDKYVNRTLSKVLRTIGFDKVYKSAKGAYLYDEEGNAYLDFLSGYGVYGIGRNHPVVGKAIKDAIDMDLSNLVQLDCALLSGLLAEALVSLTGSRRDAVFFCNSGTEANEGAIKFARAHTKRPRMISLHGAYHGLTYGSLSLTVSKNFQEGYGPLIPGIGEVEYDNLEALENELKSKDVAGFIFEPVQGKGVYYPKDDYFVKAQELCKKYGTLFIADEVQTGFGRTGKMFGYQHWDLDPDIVTVAKTLSGGYVPCAAFITTREIHQSSFSSMEKCVVHSTTFGRNNLAMVSGLATIDVLKSENLVEQANVMGEKLRAKIRTLQDKYDFIKEVRGLGLIIAIEFQEPKKLTTRLAWKSLKAANQSLFIQMIVTMMMENHRILTQIASHNIDVLKILPPYVITDKEIDLFVNALDDTLSKVGNVASNLLSFGKRLLSAASEEKASKKKLASEKKE